jgi:UPF0113 Pre-PUA domain
LFLHQATLSESMQLITLHLYSVDLTAPRCRLQETKQVFEKLYKYIGKDIKTLIDRTDAPYVIRLQRNRVFYVREDIMRRATNVRPAPLIAHAVAFIEPTLSAAAPFGRVPDSLPPQCRSHETN